MQEHLPRLMLAAGVVAVVAALSGCGSGLLIPSYTGGGLPPGDIDIGGVVLMESTTAVEQPEQDTTPVVGAEVVLFRGRNEVGRTLTGAGGYFRFANPDSGSYAVEVEPPAGSGLARARRQFRHQAGRQTFLTIMLEPQ